MSNHGAGIGDLWHRLAPYARLSGRGEPAHATSHGRSNAPADAEYLEQLAGRSGTASYAYAIGGCRRIGCHAAGVFADGFHAAS
jgi:hypothetical protein